MQATELSGSRLSHRQGSHYPEGEAFSIIQPRSHWEAEPSIPCPCPRPCPDGLQLLQQPAVLTKTGWFGSFLGRTVGLILWPEVRLHGRVGVGPAAAAEAGWDHCGGGQEGWWGLTHVLGQGAGGAVGPSPSPHTEVLTPVSTRVHPAGKGLEGESITVHVSSVQPPGCSSSELTQSRAAFLHGRGHPVWSPCVGPGCKEPCLSPEGESLQVREGPPSFLSPRHQARMQPW